jgi:hypothetical protein
MGRAIGKWKSKVDLLQYVSPTGELAGLLLEQVCRTTRSPNVKCAVSKTALQKLRSLRVLLGKHDELGKKIRGVLDQLDINVYFPLETESELPTEEA